MVRTHRVFARLSILQLFLSLQTPSTQAGHSLFSLPKIVRCFKDILWPVRQTFKGRRERRNYTLDALVQKGSTSRGRRKGRRATRASIAPIAFSWALIPSFPSPLNAWHASWPFILCLPGPQISYVIWLFLEHTIPFHVGHLHASLLEQALPSYLQPLLGQEACETSRSLGNNDFQSVTQVTRKKEIRVLPIRVEPSNFY